MIGQSGGKGGDVVLAGTEQHRDDVGLVFRIVTDRSVAEVLGLSEAEPVDHAQHLIDRDTAPSVAGRPFLHRYGPGDVELAVAHQDSDQATGDALGHRPRDEGAIGLDAGAVVLGDDGAVLHDDHGIRALEIFRLGLAEGSVQQPRELLAVDARIEVGPGPLPGWPRYPVRLGRQWKQCGCPVRCR